MTKKNIFKVDLKQFEVLLTLSVLKGVKDLLYNNSTIKSVPPSKKTGLVGPIN